MAKNKVVYGDTTIMDITDTTAEAADVADGKVFYGNDGERRSGTGNYMDKVSDPTADDILVTDANGQAVDSGVKLAEKQDVLVSGTNIKTINGKSVLGSGNLRVYGVFEAIPELTTFNELLDAIAEGATICVNVSGQLNVAVRTTVAQDLSAVLLECPVDLTTGTQMLTHNAFQVDNNDTWSYFSYTDNYQQKLLSGTNIKTINGISVLGSGDIDIAFTAIYGVTTYTELIAALNADKAVLVKDIPYNGDNITVLVNSWKVAGSTIEIDSIATAQGDFCDVYLTVTSADVWSETFVNRDPFMLLDFSQTINVAIPYCTENIANTSIPNVDVAITDEMGADWAIASLAKYEVVDSSNARINCWPVCSFSMNGQKTLRLRMMCAGTSRKTATKISGAILLKHR